MCRLLYARSEDELSIADHLVPFTHIAKNSKEYQGHGWGCAYLDRGEWRVYKNIQPIWEDPDLGRFGYTSLLIAHARSAFQNRGLTVENNMPFVDDRYVFVFNGELRGVRIRAEGRIGAEKIFNFIKRFDKGDMESALERATTVLGRRTEYIKAMNILVADKDKAYVASFFNEDPEYFTIHTKTNGVVIVCSEPYPGESNWVEVPNRSIKVL